MNTDDKQVILSNSVVIKTKIIVLETDIEPEIVLTEDDSVKDWDYEDFRQVGDEGWIGQFVAKQVILNLKKTTIDFNLENREFELKYAVIPNLESSEEHWYSLGNFLVKDITKDDVKDTTKIIALDYGKKFNIRYEDRITYPCTLLDLTMDICEQADVELGNTNIRNKDYIITGNVFKNGETLRDVAKAIGKTCFSWIRIGTDNKLYFDYDVKTNVDSENNFNNDNYYTLKTQNENFGPVNRVVIGYKNIDGEQTKIEDTTSIEENGLCEITIFDNPLVYNQEQREQIINSSQFLLGLNYRPCEMETIGHTWLKGNEPLLVTDMNDNSFLTYAFDRTISYFGHIKTKLKSTANTKTDSKYAFEPMLEKRLLNAEIIVDKEIGQITERVTNIEENVYTKDETNAQITISTEGIEQTVSNVSQIVDNNGKAISQLETQVQTIQTNTNLQIETIQNTLDNGVETLKNSLVTIDVEGIKVSTNIDRFMSLLSNRFIKVTSGGDEVAFFGYDTELGKTIARIPELETQSISSGYHKWDSFIDDTTGEARSGWFYKGV